MRPIAEYVMRGRMEAITVMALTTALPILHWIGAAAASLLLLRKGFENSYSVLALGLIPAVIWAGAGQPETLIVVVCTLALAAVLRTTSSWVKVLLASVVLSGLFAMIQPFLYGDEIAKLADSLLTDPNVSQLIQPMLAGLTGEQMAQVKLYLPYALAGSMLLSNQLFAVLALILGRYWQAALFNPKGFAQEFHQLRLPVAMAFGLLVVILGSAAIAIEAIVLIPVAALPLLITGIAVIHGLVGLGKSPSFWLIAMYVGLVFLSQAVVPLLIVLALVDSLFDFRGLSAKAKSTNGES
ncbi:hypothetical protein VQ643_08725 [Pseudomonas sp. F1_0610]|uniref:hypothetical protein n=1 Tax=Pseudomonas sp. F1_0610 TaxID=3114284 RepID=UPI0039C1B03B